VSNEPSQRSALVFSFKPSPSPPLEEDVSPTRIAGLLVGAALLGASLGAGPAAASTAPVPDAAAAPTDPLAAVAAYKASHDTDPHLPLAPAAQRALALRMQQARAHLTARRAEALEGGASPDATGKTLTGTQQAQQTYYWCGPAATASALAVRGVSVSQSTAANQLGATVNGTDWSGSDGNIPAAYQTGHPVADVLSYQLHGQGATYYPVGLPDSPSSSNVSAYQANLVTDIDNGWDLVGNAWEVPGGPHLVGHPSNQEIFHYFTIRGYSSSGANTQYQDSVHGASSISWSSGVPAYSTLSSNTITVINGGRGYVW
jgi:hypothetical protein